MALPRLSVILVSAALTLCACAGSETGEDGGNGGAETAGPGRLVIVGGALQADNAPVYQAIVDGREGTGPLCVVPTASGVAESSMSTAVKTFAGYVGDSAVTGVFLAESNAEAADTPEMAELLSSCSGYFFTGGDQSRVVDTFLPAGDTTLAFRALWERWQQGAVISGSSAGAAMMSGVMIASGSSEGAVREGVTTSEEDGGVWIRRGMGFFERAILDQHFLARGRIGRLLVATLATDSLPVGLGIDENTALVVDGDEAQVLGASGVVVVDARNATVSSPGFGGPVRVSLAGTGDRIDLTTFQVTRDPSKTALGMAGGVAEWIIDPFARWDFLHLLGDLAESPQNDADYQVAGASLSVREGEGFSASIGQGEGVQGEAHGLSAGPFLVELHPAR